MHGEERRGCFRGWKDYEQHFGFKNEPKVSRTGRLRWGSSVGAVGGGWKGRFGYLESDPEGLTLVDPPWKERGKQGPSGVKGTGQTFWVAAGGVAGCK